MRPARQFWMMAALLCVLFCATVARGQNSTQPDIQRRIEMIEKGQADVVRRELPGLMQSFPNHPGVLYLQALLNEDGQEAAKQFQYIVDKFPSSEWADDALYRLYQYYYSIGLYKTADQKLAQLQRDYPYSSYVTGQPEEPKQQPVAENKPAAKPQQQQPQQQKPAATEQKPQQPTGTPAPTGKPADTKPTPGAKQPEAKPTGKPADTKPTPGAKQPEAKPTGKPADTKPTPGAKQPETNPTAKPAETKPTPAGKQPEAKPTATPGPTGKPVETKPTPGAKQPEAKPMPGTKPANGTQPPANNAPKQPVTQKPADKSVAPYTVQVGAFGDRKNAEERKALFDRSGYAASIVVVEKGGMRLYKVWVGAFKTPEEAKAFTEIVQKKFRLESIVVPR